MVINKLETSLIRNYPTPFRLIVRFHPLPVHPLPVQASVATISMKNMKISFKKIIANLSFSSSSWPCRPYTGCSHGRRASWPSSPSVASCCRCSSQSCSLPFPSLVWPTSPVWSSNGSVVLWCPPEVGKKMEFSMHGEFGDLHLLRIPLSSRMTSLVPGSYLIIGV